MVKEITLRTAELMDVLPDEKISLVYELIKNLVLAWDPDYTKLTAKERETLEKSCAEVKAGDYVTEKEVWS